MTPKQKRIAIAEACGWKDVEFGVGPNSNLCLGDKPSWAHGKVQSYLVDQRVPDYFNDLNAMHEAEKFVKNVWGKYVKILNSFTDPACATAANRAEAFGLTLGLWTE